MVMDITKLQSGCWFEFDNFLNFLWVEALLKAMNMIWL